MLACEAVAARSEALAERAIRAIKVEWEELPAVFDAHKAMADGAPAIYENVLLGDVELPVEHNIACFRQVGVGDVAIGTAISGGVGGVPLH